MNETHFRIFAPYNKSCSLGIKVFGDIEGKTWKVVPMKKGTDGHFTLKADSAALKLANKTKYEYKFHITPAHRTTTPDSTPLFCTDPEAKEVHKYDGLNSVISYSKGKLFIDTFDWGDEGAVPLPQNNEIVIYELPLQWVKRYGAGGTERGIGKFTDALEKVETHLNDLGINAIQFLPTSDSPGSYHWGYGSRNYFAPDPDFGTPTEFKALIRECHIRGIRVFLDMVMNHSNDCPLEDINYCYNFIDDSHDADRQEAYGRPDWGGKLFKFVYKDPDLNIHPGREFHKKNIAHWINEYHIDGLRVDSVVSVKNWDFIGEVTSEVEKHLGGVKPHLCLGEDLPPRIDLVREGRLHALWNDNFKYSVRKAILGEASLHEIEMMVNPIKEGYSDCSQIINYVGSHDVEGVRNERIMSLLGNVGIFDDEAFKRVKLAFATLFTAVGTPMIFAGDEFGDVHDLLPKHPEKQIDPVNWVRLEGGRNRDLFDYVKSMVRLRRDKIALQQNSCYILHTDFNWGRKIVVFQRGDGADRVVVVANFSDKCVGGYNIPNWPQQGGRWLEWTQKRYPGDDHVRSGHCQEDIYPYEAKVYVVER